MEETALNEAVKTDLTSPKPRSPALRIGESEWELILRASATKQTSHEAFKNPARSTYWLFFMLQISQTTGSRFHGNGDFTTSATIKLHLGNTEHK
jgi:hypothetical protein